MFGLARRQTVTCFMKGYTPLQRRQFPKNHFGKDVTQIFQRALSSSNQEECPKKERRPKKDPIIRALIGGLLLVHFLHRDDNRNKRDD